MTLPPSYEQAMKGTYNICNEEGSKGTCNICNSQIYSNWKKNSDGDLIYHKKCYHQQQKELKVESNKAYKGNKAKFTRHRRYIPIRYYDCGCVTSEKRFKEKPFFTYKNKQYWFGLKYLTKTIYCETHKIKIPRSGSFLLLM